MNKTNETCKYCALPIHPESRIPVALSPTEPGHYFCDLGCALREAIAQELVRLDSHCLDNATERGRVCRAVARAIERFSWKGDRPFSTKGNP